MRVLQEIEGLVSSKLELIKSIFSIIKLEARLAGLSIIHLLICVFLLFIITISTWSLILAFIGYCTYLLYPSLCLAIIIPLLLNVLLTYILVRYLISNAKTMTFEKSRKYLFTKESDPNDFAETTDARDRQFRERITDSQNRKL